MKRIGVILFLAMVSLFVVGSAPLGPVYTLKIMNKANMEVSIQLVELESKRAYYFTLDEGSVNYPVEAEYAIERGIYTMSVYFDELYDPVYGDLCDDPGSMKYYADRNRTVVVRSCTQRPYYDGDTLISNSGDEDVKIKIGSVKEDPSRKRGIYQSGRGPN